MKIPMLEACGPTYQVVVYGTVYRYEWLPGYFCLEGSGGIPTSKRQDADTATSIIKRLLPHMNKNNEPN